MEPNSALEGFDSSRRWEIVAVRYGRLRTQRSDVYLNYREYGEPDGDQTVDYFFWIVRDAEQTFVIDTGFSRAGAERRNRELLIPVPEALRTLGIPPDGDVELVLTHGHYDHCGNIDYFPDQPVHMSSAEHAFWTGPDADHRQFYGIIDPEIVHQLTALDEAGRLRRIVGWSELAPGLRLVEIPGHTPGQLVALVSTEEGTILLASDAVHFSEELDRDLPFKHVTDLIGMYRGFEVIRRWRDDGVVSLVVPGHDATAIAGYPPLAGELSQHATVIGSGRKRDQP
ncbi:MAG TPA: N-acyl homoserine lactonase family protein [Pseudolysinimonas sp.]|nr:N-acyl homoserine lactonase family protein [Pseudolysinimonas sp.]